jgi:DNA-binding beta-propeller fold protein YncE
MTVSVRCRVRYSHCIGFFAEVGRGFSNPYDVAPGPDDLMYVVSRSNEADAPLGGLRVTTCGLDSSYLGEWSRYGDGPGQLVWPTAIVVDQQGCLWISDEHRHDVQAFEADGQYVGRVGGFGSGPGQLNRPAGLALDADGNLIVDDAHNSRVQPRQAPPRSGWTPTSPPSRHPRCGRCCQPPVVSRQVCKRAAPALLHT